LSLAVDVPTRMVAGFHLSFDDPSALAVALVLTHAVLPKEAWLAERDISLPWPVSGIPDWIETDNGEEFHSKAFERGAAEYGIRLTYRPHGAPQVGGHIERLIGAFMQRIHLIPGTTFSNVADKGGYDSERQAVMTLKELERWLALEILGVYHKSVHTALHQPPEQAWQQKVSSRPTPIRKPQDPGRFLLDFLPAEERLIRRDGIRMFNLHYWDNRVRAAFENIRFHPASPVALRPVPAEGPAADSLADRGRHRSHLPGPGSRSHRGDQQRRRAD
jgi:putative transposase